MKKLKLKFYCFLLVSIFIFSISISVNLLQKNASGYSLPYGVHISQRTPNNILISVNANVHNKDFYLKSLSKFLNITKSFFYDNLQSIYSNQIARSSDNTYYLFGHNSEEYGNGLVYAYFNTTLALNKPKGSATSIKVQNGYSKVYWNGTSPQNNCTYIDDDERWIWNSVSGGSVNVGLTGGGIGWNVTGNSISYNHREYDTWYLINYFGGMYGNGAITSFTEISFPHAYFASVHTVVSPCAESTFTNR